MGDRMPEVGEAVVFHDSMGVGHNALVVCSHTETCVNLVHVSSNEEEKDRQGRQIRRESSCQHISLMGGVHGNYWRYPEETPNEYSPPAAT